MKNSDQKLITMPKVASPKSLDDKILSESVRLAPSSERRFNWVPAMATVAAVAVAIVAVRPVMQTLDEQPQLQETLEATLQLNEPGQSRLEVSDDVTVETVEESFMMDSAPATGGSMVQGSGEEASSGKVPSETPVSATKAYTAAPELNIQLDEELGVAGSARQKKLESVQAEAMTEELDSSREGSADSAMPGGIIDPSTRYPAQWQSILDLMENGKEDQAQARLDKLHEVCPECDLPSTVDQIELESPNRG